MWERIWLCIVTLGLFVYEWETKRVPRSYRRAAGCSYTCRVSRCGLYCQFVQESTSDDCGKNTLFDCVSASFLPSSSDFLSQSRLNKGPHRHRIKQYCLVGDLISLHHKRPSQSCHGNLSHFFVRSIFLKFHLFCRPLHNLLLQDKAPQHNERGGIGNGKSMDTVINLGPTPPWLLGFCPSSHRGASAACCVGKKWHPHHVCWGQRKSWWPLGDVIQCLPEGTTT